MTEWKWLTWMVYIMKKDLWHPVLTVKLLAWSIVWEQSNQGIKVRAHLKQWVFNLKWKLAFQTVFVITLFMSLWISTLGAGGIVGAIYQKYTTSLISSGQVKPLMLCVWLSMRQLSVADILCASSTCFYLEMEPSAFLPFCGGAGTQTKKGCRRKREWEVW